MAQGGAIATYESEAARSYTYTRSDVPVTTTSRKDGRLGLDPGMPVPRPKPSTVGNLEISPVPLGDNPEEAAAYVAGLMAELAILVRRHHLDTLGYLLDMARLEAEEIVQRGGRPFAQSEAEARRKPA